VDWNTVCRSKEVGGLGLRRIREFNLALLGKWGWTMLEDTESLWFRVLLERYGVEGGRLKGGGREASLWWRDMHALCRDVWFNAHVSRSVGNGKKTLFWSEVWMGGMSFRERFNRLYDLSLLKDKSVFDMCQLGWGEGGEAWRWRRRLFAWEEEAMGELTLLLHNVILQVDKDDMWLWTLDTSKAFIVRSAYNFLVSQHPIAQPVADSSPWHKDVPLKVVVFAWRLFRDRLPTKDNLFHRGAIDNDSRMCVAGCGFQESSQHLFLHCNVFGSVWHFIYKWIGVVVVTPYTVPDHFNQFSYSGDVSKVRRWIIQVIWFASVWEIWKERNNRIFTDKECSVIQVVDKIKSLAFRWLKGKFPTLPFNYHGWWLSPFTMLDIG